MTIQSILRVLADLLMARAQRFRLIYEKERHHSPKKFDQRRASN